MSKKFRMSLEGIVVSCRVLEKYEATESQGKESKDNVITTNDNVSAHLTSSCARGL